MARLKVLEFYRKKESTNPFTYVLVDPVFCILINKEGQTRELILNLKGKFPFAQCPDSECFEEEAYKSYKILKDFLLGEDKELLRERWGLTKKEYSIFLFEIKKVLINNHSFYGSFKKKLLTLLEFLKFQTGRIGE